VSAQGEDAKKVGNISIFSAPANAADMLFHVQEWQMTLPEIARFLGASMSSFSGSSPNVRVIEQFKARFPQDETARDLALWHVFEAENPDIFAGMYQFWIRKNA